MDKNVFRVSPFKIGIEFVCDRHKCDNTRMAET